MNQNRLRCGVVLILAFTLAACHSGARRVDCDRHLVPINPPAPVVKSAATKPVDP
jgi:hypothetical protein